VNGTWLVQFKMKLVEDLTRKLMEELFGNFVPEDEVKHMCTDPWWPKSEVCLLWSHV
jgi:hypothetical protein